MVYGYAINQVTGALTATPGLPYAMPSISAIQLAAVSVAVNPQSTVAFVGGNAGAGDIVTFSINSTNGSLTQFGSPVVGRLRR